MQPSWVKRLFFIFVPIIFYALGLKCVDLLVSDHIIKPEWFGGDLKFFVVSNFVVFAVYGKLLLIVLNKKIQTKDHASIPFYGSVFLFTVADMDFLPQWVFQCYICVFPVTAICMSYLTFKYNDFSFTNKIWQLENQKCVWIFNKDNTLVMNSADNTTSFFSWKYNHVTNILTIFNDREKRCYSIHTDYRLTLMRIPSLETLTFLPRQSDSPVIITEQHNVEAK